MKILNPEHRSGLKPRSSTHLTDVMCEQGQKPLFVLLAY